MYTSLIIHVFVKSIKTTCAKLIGIGFQEFNTSTEVVIVLKLIN